MRSGGGRGRLAVRRRLILGGGRLGIWGIGEVGKEGGCRRSSDEVDVGDGDVGGGRACRGGARGRGG